MWKVLPYPCWAVHVSACMSGILPLLVPAMLVVHPACRRSVCCRTPREERWRLTAASHTHCVHCSCVEQFFPEGGSIRRCRRVIIVGRAWASMHCWFNVLLWHTNIDNSRICHCLLFHQHMVSKTLCSHFSGQGTTDYGHYNSTSKDDTSRWQMFSG